MPCSLKSQNATTKKIFTIWKQKMKHNTGWTDMLWTEVIFNAVNKQASNLTVQGPANY
jgi:hypothetical protein